LHEHQAGFVNRVLEASYRARTYLYEDKGKLSAVHASDLDDQAGKVTRYLLFADEVTLPSGGVAGETAFKADFQRNRRATKNGTSLKDFDLQTRLFKQRCSYMIYSAVFQGLPATFKERVYQRLKLALSEKKPDPEFAYLPTEEKRSIRGILKETLTDLPRGW